MFLLVALPLLTTHICEAALTTHFSKYGANGNVHHCRELRDARNLIMQPEIPPAKNIFFDLDAGLRTNSHVFRTLLLNSFIEHTIEVPYLAYDAHYKIRFVSPESENETKCSSEVTIKHKPVDLNRLVPDNLVLASDWSEDDETPASVIEIGDKWQHAPNAAYFAALGNKKYGAYYIAPQSHWQIFSSDAMPCSIVKYYSRVSVHDLEKCGAIAITRLANDTVRVASYAIEIGLETPRNPDFGVNLIPVHLYADKYDNFARVILISGISLQDTAMVKSATIGNMSISEENNDRFEMQLLVYSKYELSRSMIVIHSSNHAGIDLINVNSTLIKDDVFYQSILSLASNASVGVIDERLIIDLRAHKHTHHSDVCSIVVDLFVTNPRAIEVATNGQLRPLLTNHVVLYNGHSIVENDAEVIDGSQICMINNVVMPEDMSSVVGVQIVEAWLCVVPSIIEDAARKLHCASQRHTVALLKDGKLNPDFNVSIIYPGRLGSGSVELCFATSLEITDNDMLTLQAPVQRYESRIELVPRAKLHGDQSLFEKLAEEREFEGINERLRVDSSQDGPYSQYHLRRAIRKVKDGHEFHVRAVSYHVEPIVDTRHNMSESESIFVVVLVLLMFLCIFGIYTFISAVDWRVMFRRPTFAEYHRG